MLIKANFKGIVHPSFTPNEHFDIVYFTAVATLYYFVYSMKPKMRQKIQVALFHKMNIDCDLCL